MITRLKNLFRRRDWARLTWHSCRECGNEWYVRSEEDTSCKKCKSISVDTRLYSMDKNDRSKVFMKSLDGVTEKSEMPPEQFVAFYKMAKKDLDGTDPGTGDRKV